MSIIFVRKTQDSVRLGSDSQETSGESCRENFQESKLRKIKDDVYVGLVGNCQIGSLLFAYLEEHPIDYISDSLELANFFKEFFDWTNDFIYDPEDKPLTTTMCQFTIVIGQDVWYFNNFYIRKLLADEYIALGSARQAALAVASLGHSVEEILEACCKVDIYCSTPTCIFEIKNKL